MKKQLFLSICLLMTLTVRSQSWRTEADSLMVNHVLANKVDYVDIYTFPEELTSADTIYSVNGFAIPVPYNNCIGYFVNLMPFANWAHPCKYCFVNASNNYTIVDAEMPPYNDSLIALSLCPRINSNPTTPIIDTIGSRISQHCNNDSEHLWAVLICGNDEISRDEDQYPKYWFDLSCVYTVLADVFGYQENTDESFQNRRIIVMAPELVRMQYGIPDLNGNDTYLNNDLWFSSDNGGDFFFSDDYSELTFHTKNNIKNVFDCFAGTSPYQAEYADFGLRKLTEEDQLFIFITGHGNQDGENSFFFVNESQHSKPRISDYEFVEWLQGIDCSQMTLFMESCYSGGFIDKFMEDISEEDCICKNRIGFSAASANGPSHAEGYKVYSRDPSHTHSNDVSEFVYYWASAALGYYPYFSANSIVTEGPWTTNSRNVGSDNMNWRYYFGNYENSHPHSQYDVNPDSDEDGILSFNEMFEFANNLDTWSSQGYCHPNTLDPEYILEIPQKRYESTFTKEAATLVGYEGQIDSIANTGTAIQPYRLCGDIWVSPNSELTIWDEVQSPEIVRVFVKPSGKLILDGATLTNLPEGQSPMWKGVQVWGNSSTHQHEVNGSFGQGYIELKNGAVIENAKCAVELWRPGYYSTTGGIIHATDATFRNNARAVHALWYSNVDGGREGDYNGYFRNCSFIVDEDYIGTKAFHKHVDLAHVKGLDFLGCDFFAKRSVDSVSHYCMGIGAYEAGFRVDSYCTNANTTPCPGEDLIPSSFNGFYRGIHASNDGSSARAFSVRHSEFTNNTCGIYMLNTGYGTIVDNEFVVGCGSSCDFGIYADGVSGFCIEDNTFRPKALNSGAPYGIMVANSEGVNDIYHNDFTNLRCGNVAVGVNTATVNSPRTSPSGLTYTCNTNTGNLIDFCVLKDGNVGGIAQQQGSATLPAGNTFSGSLYHFYNDGVEPIYYWYDSYASGQTPTLLYRVNTNNIQSTNSCFSHYSGGAVSKSASEKLELSADYQSARSTYTSLLQLYESRIDGGSTPTQVADINSATPSDMWNLRARLLGFSPYVSGEVLTTAAERYDVFSDPVLFEILAANPDELQRDSLITYLENKEHPLPSYMTDLLRQIASGFTARTAMLAQMAQYNHTYSLAAGDIVRSCLSDSVTDHVELRTWLGNMEDLASDRMVVASYLQDGDSVHAFALANMLPELYGLQGDALADHSDYMRLIGLYQTLNREGRTVFELTDTESAMVNSIASLGTGTSKTMAEAILMERSAENITEHFCPTMPEDEDGGRGRSGFSETLLNEAVGFNVSVSPNPATTWARVDYTLPASAHSVRLSLTNTYGVTVANYNLSAGETQKVLDLRFLDDGVYFYTVLCGKHSQTGKLIIVK